LLRLGLEDKPLQDDGEPGSGFEQVMILQEKAKYFY
jgi:hypothetical protein